MYFFALELQKMKHITKNVMRADQKVDQKV